MECAVGVTDNQISKQKKAFIRKLYLAHLIDNERHNLLSLSKLTAMPRRTLQDAIVSMGDVGIECEFVQDGARHNAGYYQLRCWGPINPLWIKEHLNGLLAQLQS
nr:winged helix-turn-helix domain-containing protein [Shewanella algidipiscicola]